MVIFHQKKLVLHMQKNEFFDEKVPFFFQKRVFFGLIIDVKNEDAHDF